MDSQTVVDFSTEVFRQFTTEPELAEQFLFSKAMQKNDQLAAEVKKEFIDRVNAVVAEEDHQAQKCAFRQALIENIRNMAMWQEYFKIESPENTQIIYSFFKNSCDDIEFDAFEKQWAYYQLFCESMYSMLQAVLNQYYDEVKESSYVTMLVYAYRKYYENFYESIVAQEKGEEDEAKEVMAQLVAVTDQVEEAALKGEEVKYDMSRFE